MKLIDADALKKVIYFETNHLGIDFHKSKLIGIAIDNAPTIDAEPIRHGKWIVEAEDWRHQIEWFKCSCCGFPTSTTYKYCPNCAARMEGVEE